MPRCLRGSDNVFPCADIAFSASDFSSQLFACKTVLHAVRPSCQSLGSRAINQHIVSHSPNGVKLLTSVRTRRGEAALMPAELHDEREAIARPRPDHHRVVPSLRPHCLSVVHHVQSSEVVQHQRNGNRFQLTIHSQGSTQHYLH